MTIFDIIKDYNEEQMIEFLYRFSEDVINQFGNFILPDKENIKNFLEEEAPWSD